MNNLQLPFMAQFSVPTQIEKPRRKSKSSRSIKSKANKHDSASYTPFNDDYFWELLKSDYNSAWKYVARMNRSYSI